MKVNKHEIIQQQVLSKKSFEQETKTKIYTKLRKKAFVELQPGYQLTMIMGR